MNKVVAYGYLVALCRRIRSAGAYNSGYVPTFGRRAPLKVRVRRGIEARFNRLADSAWDIGLRAMRIGPLEEMEIRVDYLKRRRDGVYRADGE